MSLNDTLGNFLEQQTWVHLLGTQEEYMCVNIGLTDFYVYVLVLVFQESKTL